MKTALTIIAVMTAVMFVVGIVSAAPVIVPSCDFTVSQQSGIEDLTVTFTASYRNFTPPVYYDWNFGDGQGAIKLIGSSISHTYTNPGKYDVRLVVYDEGFPTTPYVINSKDEYITVYHELPVASFTASQTTIVGRTSLPEKEIGNGITFTSTSTGYIENYEWYLDGEVVGVGEEIVRHFGIVSVPETHTVVLRAYGDGGYDDSDPLTITVNPQEPHVDFSALSIVGVRPFTVTFVDKSSGYGITSWMWNFGDGNTSSVQNPVHTYSTAGSYTVSLRADAGIYGNATETKSAYITVLNTSTDICPPVPVCPEPTICPVVPKEPIDVAGTFKSGTWQLDPVTTNVVHFGLAGDIPVALDVNGDGVTDIGIFRNGRWAFDTNGDGVVNLAVRFGTIGDIPITGNFNGAGNTDIGIYRPSSGAWRFDYNLDGIVDDGFTFGAGGLPVLGNWQNPT